MTNPLTSLDELIWKQFEKVTQYAHKNYGGDKWDLARMADSASSISMIGTSVYLSMKGVLDSVSRWQALGVGIFMGTLGYVSYGVFKEKNNRLEIRVSTVL